MKGFTLIELLVVVLIIGILAAVALPQYQTAVTKTRYATLKNMTESITQAEELYYMENGSYTVDFRDLDIEPSGCTLTTDGHACDYEWGRCLVEKGSSYFGVSCVNNDINMAYATRPIHGGPRAGQRLCYAYNRDLSSVQNKVCKADTQAASPESLGDENYYVWVYKYSRQ